LQKLKQLLILHSPQNTPFSSHSAFQTPYLKPSGLEKSDSSETSSYFPGMNFSSEQRHLDGGKATKSY